VLDDVAKVLAHRDPHAGQLARRTRVLGILRPDSAHGGQWPLYCADDVRDGDLVGVLAQAVPDLDAAPAADETGWRGRTDSSTGAIL